VNKIEKRAKQARDTADLFYKAYVRCYEPMPIETDPKFDLTLPSIVSLSLCCEICLKAIYMCQEGKFHEEEKHSLRYLYNRIDDVRRNKIKKLCVDEYKRNYFANENVEENSFEVELKKVSHLFANSRYMYERDKLDVSIGFLVLLTDACFDALEDEIDMRGMNKG